MVAMVFAFSEYAKMRRFLVPALLLLTVLTCLAGAKKAPKVIVRFYAQVPTDNGSTFATQVPLLDGSGSIWITKVATVSENEITAFMPFQNVDGSVGAYFFLDDHGKLLLETLSMEQRGKILIGIINGRHVTDLMIDKRISDGIITIPGGITPQELDLIRKTFKIRESSHPAPVVTPPPFRE